MPTAQEIANAMFTYQGPAQPFTTQPIALTTAHTDLEIYIPSQCRFIQAFSDGSLEGVTIKIQDQSNYPVDLSKINTIASGGATRFYLTNDVRAGRSTLTLYYHFILPGERTKSGENISREELAARLGSISTFDRRGEIIFKEDFENGNLKTWTSGTLTGSGTGGEATISNAKSLSGQRSCRITTGNVSGDDWTIKRRIIVPFVSRFGLELASILPSSNLGYFRMDLVYYTGTVYYAGGLYYDGTNLKYYNTGGTYTTIEALALNTGSIFHRFKLVLDFLTHKYVRAIVDNNFYDLSSYLLYTTASANSPYLDIQILVANGAAANVSFYVDDIIVTQNEL